MMEQKEDRMETEEELLRSAIPASVRQGHRVGLPPTDAGSVLRLLRNDLSVKRIDDIDRHLWLVGRPYPPRPLSLYRVLERDIVPTGDTSLHLVWTTGKIYLRPIPRCLVSLAFYERYLTPPRPEDKPILGLLYSYICLVPSELDFDIARREHLLPDTHDWHAWKALVTRVLSDYHGSHSRGQGILNHVPRRYAYGELRLDRLDKIYRYFRGDLLHGYSTLTGSARYVDLFRENLAVVAASTVYLVVIVTAMSLGRTTKALKDNEAFDSACYGFAVFAIILPLVGLGLIVAVFVFTFIANYLRTLVAQGQRRDRDIQPSPKPGCYSRGEMQMANRSQYSSEHV